MKKWIWQNYKPIKNKKIKWRSIGKSGYVSAKDRNGTWRLEHRLIMEKHLGRKLKKGEFVHHIDRDKTNNKIENLLLCENHLEHTIAESVLTDTPSFIKYEINKDRKLEWEIINNNA